MNLQLSIHDLSEECEDATERLAIDMIHEWFQRRRDEIVPKRRVPQEPIRDEDLPF